MAGPLSHDDLMRAALDEAELGRGRTRPNPIVGAALARSGRLITRGHHEKAGGPHAEVVALREAGGRARGADLYVTLEPCNHQGRTGPCTEAVLAAGVRRVFIGSPDPNQHVRGGGAKRLRAAGVEVVEGVLRPECDSLNEQWVKFIRTGRPWVTLKAAVSLDGKLAARSGDSRWVSGERSRQLVHDLRDELDAVMVGIGTALADDPRLTVRTEGRKGRPLPPRDPVRVVVDSNARLPPRARMLRQRSRAPTWVAVGPDAPPRRVRALEAAGAQIVPCKGTRAGLVDPADLLVQLGRREITSVLVEGGARLHGSLLRAALWDELYLFVAPKLVGAGAPSWAAFPAVREMSQALPVRWSAVYRDGFEPDLLVTARPVG